MGYLRTMGAGLAGSTVRYKGANVNQVQFGDKLQGLPPVTGNRRPYGVYKAKVGGQKPGRDTIFCINQLGGIMVKNSQFASNADGVKDCHPLGCSNSSHTKFWTAVSCMINGKGTLPASALKLVNCALSSDDWTFSGYTPTTGTMMYGGGGVLTLDAVQVPGTTDQIMLIGSVLVGSGAAAESWLFTVLLNNISPVTYVGSSPAYSIPNPSGPLEWGFYASKEALDLVKKNCGSVSNAFLP